MGRKRLTAENWQTIRRMRSLIPKLEGNKEQEAKPIKNEVQQITDDGILELATESFSTRQGHILVDRKVLWAMGNYKETPSFIELWN